MVGGVSTNSAYYKNTKRQLGFLNDCVGLEFMLNNVVGGDDEYYSPQEYYEKYGPGGGTDGGQITSGGPDLNVVNMIEYDCNYNFFHCIISKIL